MTLLYLFVITISGVLASYLILKKLSLLERISIGFGIGLLIVSLILFVLVTIEIPLSKDIVLYSVGSTTVLLAIFNTRNLLIIKDIKNIKLLNLKEMFSNERKYLWLLVILIGGFLLLETIFWPISAWDALALYDFRGKIFAEGLLFKDIQILDSYDTYNPGYYFSYPVFTSLIHASFYLLGIPYPQIIYPIIFFALVIFFYKSLSRYIDWRVASIFSVVLFLSNTFISQARTPYTNLPYTYFYFVSSILLIRFAVDNRKDMGILFMSALFLAGASWVRFIEPFYYVNILFLLFLALRKKISRRFIVLFFVPILGLRYMWKNILETYAKQSFLSNISIVELARNMLNMGWHEITQTMLIFYEFLYENILLFSILAISTALYFVEKRNRRLEIVKWVMIIIYSNLSIVFLGTLVVGLLLPGRVEIYASLGRVGMFLYPFIIFVAALSVKRFFIRKTVKLA